MAIRPGGVSSLNRTILCITYNSKLTVITINLIPKMESRNEMFFFDYRYTKSHIPYSFVKVKVDNSVHVHIVWN